MEQKVDMVTFEVVKHAFLSAVFESSTMIEELAYHPVITMGRDRSSGILTLDGRLIGHGLSDCAPHYGTFETAIKLLLEDIPIEQMKPRDMYIFNDPFRGGVHVNDHALVRPIFYKGEIFGFALIILHWADSGGPSAGSFNPRAREHYAEGFHMTPIKLYENDQPIEPLFRTIALNIRAAVERRCDITAHAQGCRLLDRRVVEVLDKYGVETVQAVIEEHFNHQETMVRSLVRELPDGVYKFEDFGDSDVNSPDKHPIGVRCTMTISGDEITFDWSESDPQPLCSWGIPRPGLASGTYLGFMACFPDVFPLNHGVIRAINIISKPGTCVHVLPPTPTTGYCSGAFDKIEHVTIGCLAQALVKVRPQRVYPGAVGLTNVCISGVRPETGREYVYYFANVGGGQAYTFHDGISFSMMRFTPRGKMAPMELEERWFPALFTECKAEQDSGGHGKYRGGLGMARRMKILGDCVITIHGDREKFGPYGLGGGFNGGGATAKVNVGRPDERDIGMTAVGEPLRTGDEIRLVSCGGGGYGDPYERDPNLVLEDVMDGWLSLKAAREIYRVAISVIDEEALQYEIDKDETERLRAELPKKAFPRGLAPQQVHPVGEKIKI